MCMQDEHSAYRYVVITRLRKYAQTIGSFLSIVNAPDTLMYTVVLHPNLVRARLLMSDEPVHHGPRYVGPPQTMLLALSPPYITLGQIDDASSVRSCCCEDRLNQRDRR